MKYILSLAITLTISAGALAQGSTMTLDECVKYALENSSTTRNAALDEQIAEAKVKETIGIGLPQVNGNVNLTHNQKLRRFFSAYDPNSPFFGGAALPVNTGDVISAQNFFQLPSSGDAGVSVDQLIFNGSYLVGLKASRAYKDLAVKETKQSKEQVVENVTKAYYTALINKQRLNLFETNIARLDTLLRNTRAMHQNGFAEKIDVDRIQVTYNNLVTDRDKFRNLQVLSIELLKFQMEYPQDQSLDIAGDIAEISLESDFDNYSKDWSYTDRADYQVLLANKKLQELNIRNNYAAAMPVLSAFLNLGVATQSDNIGGLFVTNTEPSGDLPSSVGVDNWYSYSNFGLSLSIPIFSGMQRYQRIQQEKLSMMKIENGERNLKSGIDLQIKQAITNYENASNSLKAQEQNMELAADIARVTKIKYEEGVGSNLEVVDAETSLKEAQINYYNSLYDALIAKVDLQKAYGKLIDNQSEN